MFVERHCEVIEADLARFYPGVRLRHLFNGEMTWRELGVYLAWLPMESGLMTVLRDAAGDAIPAQVDPDSPHGPWSKVELLLAAMSDQLASLIYVQIARGGGKPDQPVPVRRPGVAAKKKADPAAVAYLADIRERNRLAREAN